MDSTTRRAAGETRRLTGRRAHVLQHYSDSSEILEFSPYGYDERQYCSPGFNLPVGASCAVCGAAFPSITRQPTISLSSSRYNWRNLSASAPQSWMCSKIIADIAIRTLTANHNWAGETSTGPRAARLDADDFRASLGVESLRWRTLSSGHCGAFRVFLFDDQRCGGRVVPGWLALCHIGGVIGYESGLANERSRQR